MSDALIWLFDWMAASPVASLLAIWVLASIVAGGLFSLACRLDKRERKPGINGEWY